jgi:hypothetical protein
VKAVVDLAMDLGTNDAIILECWTCSINAADAIAFICRQEV